jgi:hypothetical protein
VGGFVWGDWACYRHVYMYVGVLCLQDETKQTTQQAPPPPHTHTPSEKVSGCTFYFILFFLNIKKGKIIIREKAKTRREGGREGGTHRAALGTCRTRPGRSASRGPASAPSCAPVLWGDGGWGGNGRGGGG